MNDLSNSFRKIVKFFQKEEKIFQHKAEGEPCAVCGKPMQTRQRISQVGSGEKMHSDCWPDFFEMRINQIKENYRGDL